MFCPNCGNLINEGSKFCSNCGWSGVQKISRGCFNICDLKRKIGIIPVFLVVGLIALLVTFKIVNSFGDVASFAKEVKTVEKQFKDGDFESIFRNNIDYTDLSDYTESDYTDFVNYITSLYIPFIDLEVRELPSVMKAIEQEKQFKKIYKELENAIELKYDVEKVEDGQVKITLKFNLPKPKFLSNDKISDKMAELIWTMYDLERSGKYNNNHDLDYSDKIIAIAKEFGETVIDISKTYKSLEKDTKSDFNINLNFYKIDGHWRYRLSEGIKDTEKISRIIESYIKGWENADYIVKDFASKYGF